MLVAAVSGFQAVRGEAQLRASYCRPEHDNGETCDHCHGSIKQSALMLPSTTAALTHS